MGKLQLRSKDSTRLLHHNVFFFFTLIFFNKSFYFIHVVVDCGPPPFSADCAISYTETSCGSNAEYSPVNSTIRIFGDTTLTCGSDGTWQVEPNEDFPFCIPRKQSLNQTDILFVVLL